MPLTPDEFEALLTATSVLKDPERQQRARAVFLLMRWSGLAIGDALKLERQRVTHKSGVYRVVTMRQKTGTDVSVPLPPDVAREILAAPNGWTSSANGAKSVGDPKYLFWDGKSDIVNTWTRRLVPAVFAAAKIKRAGNMTSHRLRDTFAVDLLQKGVPLEDVSKALGHESIKTTEKHYAKWVKGRQDRLDNLIAGTWQKPPLESHPRKARTPPRAIKRDYGPV
jgi:integrase